MLKDWIGRRRDRHRPDAAATHRADKRQRNAGARAVYGLRKIQIQLLTAAPWHERRNKALATGLCAKDRHEDRKSKIRRWHSYGIFRMSLLRVSGWPWKRDSTPSNCDAQYDSRRRWRHERIRAKEPDHGRCHSMSWRFVRDTVRKAKEFAVETSRSRDLQFHGNHGRLRNRVLARISAPKPGHARLFWSLPEFPDGTCRIVRGFLTSRLSIAGPFWPSHCARCGSSHRLPKPATRFSWLRVHEYWSHKPESCRYPASNIFFPAEDSGGKKCKFEFDAVDVSSTPDLIWEESHDFHDRLNSRAPRALSLCMLYRACWKNKHRPGRRGMCCNPLYWRFPDAVFP